jgi:hypothetical protein
VPYFRVGERTFFGNDRLNLLSYHLMTMPPSDLSATSGGTAKPDDAAMLADLKKLAETIKPADKQAAPRKVGS